jgi:hypothetical protein
MVVALTERRGVMLGRGTPRYWMVMCGQAEQVEL